MPSCLLQRQMRCCLRSAKKPGKNASDASLSRMAFLTLLCATSCASAPVRGPLLPPHASSSADCLAVFAEPFYFRLPTSYNGMRRPLQMTPRCLHGQLRCGLLPLNRATAEGASSAVVTRLHNSAIFAILSLHALFLFIIKYLLQ